MCYKAIPSTETHVQSCTSVVMFFSDTLGYNDDEDKIYNLTVYLEYIGLDAQRAIDSKVSVRIITNCSRTDRVGTPCLP